MFPDFPVVKAQVNRTLIRWAKIQVPRIAPLLGQISHFRQYEGKRAALQREDGSVANMGYERAIFPMTLSREEMMKTDLPGLQQKLGAMAEQMAGAQQRMMFTKIGQGADATGNRIDVDGELRPEHLLEMFEKVQTEFDPETGQPTGQMIVLHPDTAAKIMPRVKEWEKDPRFLAAYDRIMEKKREEWRAREDCRKLVD